MTAGVAGHGTPTMSEPPLVLVVEDEEILQWVVCRMLLPLPIRVECATNAESALALMERGGVAPTLVVADHNLGGMPGLALLERLRTLRPETAALLHTADTAAIERARKAGVRCVPKGCPPEALRSAVWELVAPRAGRRRATSRP